MGSRIDALKLVSSLPLFRAGAERLDDDDPVFNNSLSSIIDLILEHAATQGNPQCARTVSCL